MWAVWDMQGKGWFARNHIEGEHLTKVLTAAYTFAYCRQAGEQIDKLASGGRYVPVWVPPDTLRRE